MKNPNYYDQISKGYEELHRDEQIKKIKLILPHLNNSIRNSMQKNSMKILDVGCGSGIFFEFVDLPAKNKVGVDPSEKLIEIAKQKNNGIYFVKSAESLNFSDNEFDLVVSLTAIQNFSDIKKGLLEMKRCGKNFFIFTFLKKSSKKNEIMDLIESLFFVIEQIEEEKDIIFICK